MVIGDVLQPTHLIFILLIALLVLGPKRLPEVGRSLGKGLRDFRGALSGMDQHDEVAPPPPPPAAATAAAPPPAPAQTGHPETLEAGHASGVFDAGTGPTTVMDPAEHEHETATAVWEQPEPAPASQVPAPIPAGSRAAKPRSGRTVVDAADPADFAD